PPRAVCAGGTHHRLGFLAPGRDACAPAAHFREVRMDFVKRFFGKHSDIAMVVLVLGVLIVLFAPIPAGLLDFLILTNFSFAFLVLLLTFYMARPVEFSTFPSLLLLATLFRLSLNVAATRLILSDGNAGKV